MGGHTRFTRLSPSAPSGLSLPRPAPPHGRCRAIFAHGGQAQSHVVQGAKLELDLRNTKFRKCSSARCQQAEHRPTRPTPGTKPMRIELERPHKSIETLSTEELPEFGILIGRNGAGKTQLLDALKEGYAKVPGIEQDDIERYDMASFGSPNSNIGSRNFNNFARFTADAYLLARSSGPALIETAESIFEQFAEEVERESGVQGREEFARNLRDEIRQLRDFTVFPPKKNRASPYKNAFYEQVMAPLGSGKSRNQRRGESSLSKNSFNLSQQALLSTAMKLSDKLPHELTRDDIMSASLYEGHTLANSISEVFAAYKVDQFLSAHRRVESEPISFPQLVAEYRDKYSPPWDALRDILSGMREAAGDDGLFNFDFSDPDREQLNMNNHGRFSFKAEMTNRTTGAQYDLDSLSSGERVLMALCLSSFNQHLGRRRPKLLLLDELDAVLHPSMIEALVSTLKSLFVQHGTKVLMTSHSPMTVAVLDETDIFRVVRKDGHVNISRTTKSEAIAELSEGLATVDAGLRIAAYDKAKVTILTEGYNTRHIKKWVQLNFPQDVHVFEELPQHSSDSQLLAYGRLLGRMNTNTHFVIVWDCDAADKAEALRSELTGDARVTPFAFKRRQDNKITRRGIENNYDESILEPFSTKTLDHKDNLLKWNFRTNRKTEFADHILKHGTHADFTHFRGLHDVVTSILESGS